MNYSEFQQAVLAAAQAQGLTDWELYYETERSESVSVFQHEIKSVDSTVSGGVCFRCLVAGRMGYASTEELSESEAARIVAAARDNAAALETEEAEFLAEGGQTYADVAPKDLPLPDAEALRAAALQGQEALYAADPQVVDGCETEAIAMQATVAICNSRGLDLSAQTKLAALVSVAVVSDGEELTDSFEIEKGDLRQMDIPAVAGKAVAAAKAKQGADVAPTGTYPVVFAPKAMSSLLATFASVFSAEAARKGLSRLGGREGSTIAGACVTLVDDPFHTDGSPIAFDAEGTPTYRKNVIENGELKTLLYTLKSAAAAGKKSTGNAAKADYAAPIGTRPFTMYLAAGSLTEEELLQKAGNGVYIDFLGGMHAGANPISGDFSLQSAGTLIENGKKTKPVKSFTVAGNFYDLLRGVTALSDTVEIPFSGAATAFGSPLVLVDGLSIAGK